MRQIPFTIGIIGFGRAEMFYVAPYWRHRSVNTGHEPLISFCVYPSDARHNHDGIDRAGFLKRAYRREGTIAE